MCSDSHVMRCCGWRTCAIETLDKLYEVPVLEGQVESDKVHVG